MDDFLLEFHEKNHYVWFLVSRHSIKKSSPVIEYYIYKWCLLFDQMGHYILIRTKLKPKTRLSGNLHNWYKGLQGSKFWYQWRILKNYSIYKIWICYPCITKLWQKHIEQKLKLLPPSLVVPHGPLLFHKNAHTMCFYFNYIYHLNER